ncbi:MAG: lysophospholipid acyltransferase family protein [Thiovulaceae bacterium]|jgi:putative hemolysin|nr:lysophospholipid acyltransferase family protein [Sulfurimonadaceae bacterium]
MAICVETYLQHNYPSFEKFPHAIKQTIVSLFKRISHESEINAFLQKHAHEDAFGFIESILDYFNVDISIHQNELSRIPSYGKVVIIANHPLGALDALALVHVLKDIRKDIKIVASNFLGVFDNLKEILIPIENVKGKLTKNSVEAIYESLKKQEAVIIFPSGEVSRARPSGIKDTKWRSGFLKVAQKMQAPILPIYIHAKNSKNFYLLSMFNKSLATAIIPHEMFKYHDKTIGFRIGKTIPFESYEIPSLSLEDKVKLFRKHLYEVSKRRRGVFKTYNSIALAENRQELKKELQKGELLGETTDGKKIYLYANDEENVLIKEIGRLREISFREVKEGSGKKRDIDEFDFYYEHIILWDEKDLEIVGSYRVAKAKEILDALDVHGLYTATLFRYKDAFYEYFENGLELGRSFVQPKYWNSRALDYLWQGIGAYLRVNPTIRYMFGPVSISRSYDAEAVSVLIYFYMHYFGSMNSYVTHRDTYYMCENYLERFEKLFAKDDYENDLLVLKSFLQEKGYAIPTLYKQYSDLCEEGGVQFMDFGIDRDFDNCVDGFILVDIAKLKPQKRKRYLGNG